MESTMFDSMDYELDFYSSIGIEDDWGYDDPEKDPYAEEDQRILKEYGY